MITIIYSRDLIANIHWIMEKARVPEKHLLLLHYYTKAIVYEKSTSRLYTVTLAYLTYIQSTSCEMPGWMNHKLESRSPGEISTTSDMQMISL